MKKCLAFFLLSLFVFSLFTHQLHALKILQGKQHVDIKSIVRKQLIGMLAFSVVGLNAVKLLPKTESTPILTSTSTTSSAIESYKRGNNAKNPYYNAGDELRGKANAVRNWDYYKMIMQQQDK